jgi:alanine dehydrogenase
MFNKTIIKMKFGIIKERKNPPDRRVVFSPFRLEDFKNEFPLAEIKVESSDVRIFTDAQYKEKGFEVVTDMTDCVNRC